MTRPLVLMHGLWDTPRLFRRLIQAPGSTSRATAAGPHLPHGLGVIPLRELARRLDRADPGSFRPIPEIDLLGFSMGGVIGRIWLQELERSRSRSPLLQCRESSERNAGCNRSHDFCWQGAADMKIGSALLRDLNRDVWPWTVHCRSYFCRWDLMVCPGWRRFCPWQGRQVECRSGPTSN